MKRLLWAVLGTVALALVYGIVHPVHAAPAKPIIATWFDFDRDVICYYVPSLEPGGVAALSCLPRSVLKSR